MMFVHKAAGGCEVTDNSAMGVGVRAATGRGVQEATPLTSVKIALRLL